MSDADDQPMMTPDELREAQRSLGLSDVELAHVLGLKNPQQIRRLKAPIDAGHHREIQPWHVRLILAYLSGYRPPDWPWNRATISRLSRQRVVDEPPDGPPFDPSDDEI